MEKNIVLTDPKRQRFYIWFFVRYFGALQAVYQVSPMESMGDSRE
jgi:hypothetical protein